MAYTTIDNPELYFQTKLYAGNGGTQSITLDGSENMQPDWVWIKNRSGSDQHSIYDSVRGANKVLRSNSDASEGTQTDGLTSFDSDGFSVGASGSVNTSSNNFASWNWKAGTSFTNDASATGIGTIDSSGSVNDTAGFSICSYTGTGSAGTWKHGLSTTPQMVIIKKRNSSSSSNWMVYHIGLGGPLYHIWFDLTNDRGDDTNSWNNTAPTSSVFSIGTRSENNNNNDTYIAYCFSNRKGFSKFGSYTGNGNADGTFVFCGFRPAFLITKKTNGTDNWGLLDNKRDGYNLTNKALTPNSSGTEYTSNSPAVDFVANGFKIRESDGVINGSGDSYIYMAFAESPFVTSTGIPTVAR